MKKEKAKMKLMPVSERPYERCLEYGAQALTDAQLLAVILKNGSREESAVELATRLLCHQDLKQGLGVLYQMQLPDLMQYNGIGEVKAITLLCVVELAKRLSRQTLPQFPVFQDAQTIAAYFMESMRHLHQEHFKVLLLDSKNHLLKELDMSKGTVNASLVSSREVMIEVLRYEAVNFILLHNHPSGDATPSRADIAVTKKLKQAGDLLDVELLDHIVIGDCCYTSMRAEGLMG